MSEGPRRSEDWDWDDEPASSRGVIATAVAARDARLLAAAARAGVALPPDARPALASLADTGLRVVDQEVGGGPSLGLAPVVGLELTTDDVPPPPMLTTMRPRRSLVGLLAACRVAEATHPYPGRPATVADVVAALGAGGDDGRSRHIKGGLRTLASHGLVELDEDRVDEDAVVRLGPAVASWAGPWVVEDLPALLDGLAEVRP